MERSSELLGVALEAARAGAALVMKHYRSGERVGYEEKARNDFVTAVDREAEEAVVGTIRSRYPRHAFLAEETGQATPGEEILWIIDPLDGTTNFIHGFPVFAVSVAAMEFREGQRRTSDPAAHPQRPRLDPGALLVGVVIDPVREETFTAVRGEGARLSNSPIKVSNAVNLQASLLATGFPFRVPDLLPPYMRIFEDLNRTTQGIRRPGSAALDLSWVAAGRVDGFFEFGLSAWDMAAGALIVTEAGGFVQSFTGADDYLDTGHIVAGTPPVTTALLQAIARHYP